MGSGHWNQEEGWLWRNSFSWIFSLCYWYWPFFSRSIPIFKGCLDSPEKTFPPLLHGDPRRSCECEACHVPLQAQRLMVLPPVDAIYFLDFTSYPRWNSSRPVDMPIWKNFSFALLALCNNHVILTSYVLVPYVFNRDQTNDVFKTWDAYWCLRWPRL